MFLSSQIGEIRISGVMLRAAFTDSEAAPEHTTAGETLFTLMSELIILRAECRLDSDELVYRAYSPQFRALDEGEVIPQYAPQFSAEDGGVRVTFVEVARDR